MLEDSDCDEGTDTQLNSLFDVDCKLIVEEEVASDDAFILHIAGTSNSTPNIAVGTSNKSCEVYNFSNNQLAKLDTVGEHLDVIVGVQFSPDNNDLLYTASADRNLRLWDLRTPNKAVSTFKDTSNVDSKPEKLLSSFDVCSNNRLLAAGTELYEGEAFILFWDVRNVKILGGYWESHTDDITELKFHPDNVNLLVSGSTDGLVNTYDLQQTSEDDALLDSLNTESSVERLAWFSYKGKDCLCCITHTADVQLWRTDGVEPYVHFTRSVLGKELRRKSEIHSYVTGAHRCLNEDLFLVCGSNWNDGECVRTLKINNSTLEPMSILHGNKQRVRSSWYNQYHNLLVTGGERGILNVWRMK